MAALDFPSSPTSGQLYTANGKTWRWSGTMWVPVNTAFSTVPENPLTGTSYTLVLTDAGKMLTLSNAAAIALTIPTNASVPFEVDTRIDLIQWGAGQVTVGGAGVTIRSSGSKLKTAGQYSGATLWKKDTNEWWFGGDIAA